MRKAFIILTGVLCSFLFTACKQFTADIDDYLSYWSAESYITDSTIKAVLQNDVNRMPCVPSAEDVSVIFKLNNPKSFLLDLPPEVDAAKKMIVFPYLAQAPEAGTDYTLIQSEDRQRLILTYKASFLQAHEWGAQELSSVLTLYAKDGRKFKQSYTSKLKANTPPPTPIFTVVKTKASPAYYVLCITVPYMDKTVTGGLLHKDIARIEVNGTPYACSVNEAQTSFIKPKDSVFIAHSDVEKLSDTNADNVPADSSWVLFYKTDVEVKDGSSKKGYAVKFIDEKGLVSGTLNASTKPNKPEAEKVRITKGTVFGSGSGAANNPVIISCDRRGAEAAVSSATGNTVVHCMLTDIGSATYVQYNGNPVTIPMPLNGAGEKIYKLEYYTDGEGFSATPMKVVYYRVVLGHTVTFNANGGKYADGSTVYIRTVEHNTAVTAPDPLPVKEGMKIGGWYQNADSTGAAWNFATPVTRDITLYVRWIADTNTPYTVEHYQQELDGTYPSAATGTDTGLTGTTGASLSVGSGITLKTYPGFEYDHMDPASPIIAANGKTVVKVYYKRKQITVTFKLNGGNIGGNTDDVTKTDKYGATLTKPADPEKTGYTFSRWQPVPPAQSLGTTPTFPVVNAEYTAQWTANTYKVRFNKNDSNASGIMSDQDFTYDESKPLTSNGFTKTGYIFDGWATSAGGSKEYSDQQSVSNLTTTANGTVDLYAKWGASSSTHYTVEHYKQELDGTYPTTTPDIEHKTGTTGQSAAYTPKTETDYPGFKYDSTLTKINNVVQTSGTINADGMTAVKLYYQRKTYAVSFSVDGSAGGSIAVTAVTGGSVTSTSPVTVKHEGSVTFTASPNTGWEIDRWTVSSGSFASGGTTGAANARLDNITGTKNITVKFKKKVYTVTFSVDGGTGGSLKGVYNGTPAQTETASGSTSKTLAVAHGEAVTFTASPNTGWEVDSWTGATANTPNTTATLSNVTGNATVTVKFKLKKYNVTFSVDGGTGGSLDGTYSGNTQTASGGTERTFTVTHDGSVTFTASPNTGWEVDSWTLDGSSVNGTNTSYTLSGITGTKNVKVKFKKKVYTVTFSVDGGTGGSLKGVYNGTPAQTETASGGTSKTLAVAHGDSVTFTASPNTGWEVDSWTGATANTPNTTATLSGVTAATAVTVTFKKTYTVTFKVDGGHGSLKGKYNGSDKTAAEGGQETFTVLDGGSVTFTAEPSARYAVRSWTVSPGNFTSGGTGSETMATLSNITENKTVTVTFFENTIEGGSEGWKKLKKAVQEAPAGGTIIIDGTISATSAPDNNGEIVIDKNLTVKKANSVIPAVLDANKEEGGKPKHRIFKVISGKQLTLENLMLKGGMATGGSESDGGGAIYAQSATVKITDCNITDNEASANGGAIYAQSATVKITGGDLTNNKAELNGGAVYATKENDAAAAEVTISHSEIKGNTVNITSGFGGGIYINDNCKLTLDNTKIIENKAARGGGMRVNNSTAKMTTCTIQENEGKGTAAIDGGGGVYIHRGTLTMTDNCRILSNVVKGHALGGGMIIEGAIVTMKDCILTGNKADTKGGGVWLKYGAFTMQGSTTVTLHTGAGQNDVYLSNDKMITVDSTLNPTGSTAARITPETYGTDRQVLDGSAIGSNYNKFTVTPNGSQTWSVDSDGKLKRP